MEVDETAELAETDDDGNYEDYGEDDEQEEEAAEEQDFGTFLQYAFQSFRKGRGKGKKCGKARSRGRSFSSGGSSSSRSGSYAANRKTGRCKDCHQYGHWGGDPDCPKVISGEVPPFGGGQPSQGKSKGKGPQA